MKYVYRIIRILYCMDVTLRTRTLNDFTDILTYHTFAMATFPMTITLDTPDEDVVAAVLVDAEEYGILMERYEAKLDRYIRRLGVREHEDRQDVLQEIFLKAYRNLNGFDIDLSFSSWLYRIAHNEAISWYRKKNVRPEGHLVDDAETIFQFVAAAAVLPSTTTRERINAQEIERALGEIPKKYQAVLILRFFEHKEYEEISDILKIPVGTVGTLLHRGKIALQKQLNDEAIDI